MLMFHFPKRHIVSGVIDRVLLKEAKDNMSH